MQDNLLVMDQVSFSAGGHLVLDSISAQIPKGQTTVIMGPSGCGKSTLLKVCAGLLLPTSGSIFIEGRDFSRFTDPEMVELRGRTGFAFQNSALWANKTAYQNIELPLNFHFPKMTKKEVQSRILDLCKKLGFDDDIQQRPSQLSLGEQKIISMARALSTDPQYLFLDDPSSSLDGQGLGRLTEVLKNLKTTGKTLIIVTQNPNLTSQFADSLLLLKSGKILVHDTFQEVVKSNDPQIRNILTDVLSQTSTYSGDILDLLSDDNSGSFFS